MSIKAKLTRLAVGAAPRVLDLFAGCGGLSLGFQRAGFEIAAAIEFDELAAASHGLNFHPGDERHAVARDITTTSPAELCAELGLGDVAGAVDLVIGGPPCQAFARVGRAKLREVLARTERNVLASDGTAVFGDDRSLGSMLTARLCGRHGKPCLIVPLDSDPVEAAGTLRVWIAEHRVKTLNVAGNRASQAPGIAAFVTAVLERALGAQRVAFSSEARDE